MISEGFLKESIKKREGDAQGIDRKYWLWCIGMAQSHHQDVTLTNVMAVENNILLLLRYGTPICPLMIKYSQSEARVGPYFSLSLYPWFHKVHTMGRVMKHRHLQDDGKQPPFCLHSCLQNCHCETRSQWILPSLETKYM